MEFNGRKIKYQSLQVDGIWTTRGCIDPYWSYAEYEDGTPLTEDDLEELNQSSHYEGVYEWLADHR